MTGRFRGISTAATLAACLSMATIARANIEGARAALANGDYPAAVEALDTVLEQRPGDPQAQFLKGLALARSGDADGARKHFEQLVHDYPDMAEAWNNLGVLRARQLDLAAARNALQEATRIDPQHGSAQENLGDVYAALARRAYARASELESGNMIALAKRRKMTAFIKDTRASAKPVGASGPEGAGAKATLRPESSTPKKAVASWARAWSKQDIEAYLGMYDEDFEPAEAASRAAWEKERRERLSAPAHIKVRLDDLRIERRGAQALVRFDQRYESELHQGRERKALLLEQASEGWKIRREDEADRVDFRRAYIAPSSFEATAPPGAEAMAQPEVSGPHTAPRKGAAADKVDKAKHEGKASVEGVAAIQSNVRAALEKWAHAWSRQNMQGYLNAYSDNFEPGQGQSIAEWVRERRDRVIDPAWVRVELNDIEVAPLDNGRVRATFEQHYESSTREGTEDRQVALVYEDGGWRIIRES